MPLRTAIVVGRRVGGRIREVRERQREREETKDSPNPRTHCDVQQLPCLSPLFQSCAPPFPVALKRAGVDREAFPTVPSFVAVLAVAASNVVPALASDLSVVGGFGAAGAAAAAAAATHMENGLNKRL